MYGSFFLYKKYNIQYILINYVCFPDSISFEALLNIGTDSLKTQLKPIIKYIYYVTSFFNWGKINRKTVFQMFNSSQ